MALGKFKLDRRRLAKAESKWVEDNVKRALDDWEHPEAYAKLPEGLHVDRPDIDPHMPEDVTKLDNQGLGRLHGQMVAMCEWLDWKLAEAEIFAANQEALLKHVEAETRLRKSGTVKDKDAKTLNDEKFVQTELKALSLTARVKLLRARVRGYERNSAALSREMTRRTPNERHV